MCGCGAGVRPLEGASGQRWRRKTSDRSRGQWSADGKAHGKWGCMDESTPSRYEQQCVSIRATLLLMMMIDEGRHGRERCGTRLEACMGV